MFILVGIRLRTYPLKVNNAANFIKPLVYPNACYIFNQRSSKQWSSSYRKPITRMYNLQPIITERYKHSQGAQDSLRRRGKLLLDDIRERKHKMKEKMDAIIERENVYTIPNLLCSIRIMLSPYLGHLILENEYHFALYIMVFAGITDLLDGLIARHFQHQSSKLGSFLDPLADKVLIATMFLSLTYVELMPVFLTSIIIIRDVSLAGAATFIRYKSLPPPKTLSRYFDVSHATAQLSPTFISKVNTLVQLCTVAVTLTAPVFQFVDHPALHVLWWITGGTTVVSGLSYIFSKNTYRLLKQN